MWNRYWFDRPSAQKVDERIQRALFFFACTNSSMNPIIYGIFNIRQRNKVRIYYLKWLVISLYFLNSLYFLKDFFSKIIILYNCFYYPFFFPIDSNIIICNNIFINSFKLCNRERERKFCIINFQVFNIHNDSYSNKIYSQFKREIELDIGRTRIIIVLIAIICAYILLTREL